MFEAILIVVLLLAGVFLFYVTISIIIVICVSLYVIRLEAQERELMFGAQE